MRIAFRKFLANGQSGADRSGFKQWLSQEAANAEKAAAYEVAFDSVCELLSLYAGVSVFDAPLEWTGVVQDTIDAVVLDAAGRAACVMTFEFGFVYHDDPHTREYLQAACFVIDSRYRDLSKSIERFALAIIQPNFEPSTAVLEATRADVVRFGQQIQAAVQLAGQPGGALKMGRWCRQCSASRICPAQRADKANWTTP